MASFLATKTGSVERAIRLWRVLPLSFIRNLSTDSENPSSAAAPSAEPQRRRKKKNLFEIAQFLPNWGLGYHVAKTHWDSVSYEITKINLYKDGMHGKAWGIAHKDGSAIADAPKKISGVHKRCWRYLPNSKKILEITPKPEAVAV